MARRRPSALTSRAAIDRGRGAARNRRHGAGQRGGPGTRARCYPRLRRRPFGDRAAGGAGRGSAGAGRRTAAPTQSRETARPSAALVSLLKVLLAAKSEQHHVAPRLVASSEDIDRLALEEVPDVPSLHGWRREVLAPTPCC